MREVSSVPGSILPGAVRLATERVPPSHRVALDPRRGALLAPTHQFRPQKRKFADKKNQDDKGKDTMTCELKMQKAIK